MNEKLLSFAKSLLSRKIVFVSVGLVLVILFPESETAILSIVGIYAGTNVAQKFAGVAKSAGTAKSSLVDLLAVLKAKQKKVEEETK